MLETQNTMQEKADKSARSSSCKDSPLESASHSFYQSRALDKRQ